MRVLVFGHSGQVACELRSDACVTALGRETADLMQPGSAKAAIEQYAPDAVINAAAWTAVDQAEEAEEAAARLNAGAPGEIAQACAARTIPMVHISTDYVFAGDGDRAWLPASPTGPLGAYGRTKLVGEQAVQEAGGVYAILRTSWVFSAHGANFVKTMLRLAETRSELNVVDDQIGGPTPADAIAAACLKIARQLVTDSEASGIYHFSGAPDASWADFAREIFARAGKEVSVTGIPSSAYPTPAARPLNSRLDCATTETLFGVPRPDWREGLDRVLKCL